VVDCFGMKVGRIRHIHRPDALAVADDGRRVGQPGDIAAMLPGWSVRILPALPGPTAARLVREGYLEVAGGPPPTQLRYVAWTDVVLVHEESVHLAIGIDALPAEGRIRR
jgi:hypothetical protein